MLLCACVGQTGKFFSGEDLFLKALVEAELKPASVQRGRCVVSRNNYLFMKKLRALCWPIKKKKKLKYFCELMEFMFRKSLSNPKIPVNPSTTLGAGTLEKQRATNRPPLG